MEGIILLDSSVLIDHFRKKDKSRSFFYPLSHYYQDYAISAIVHFEIFVGSTVKQTSFWQNLFSDFIIIPFTPALTFPAVQIKQGLQRIRINIDFKDMEIAATAIKSDYPLATLNKKHFEDITDLILVTPDSV